MVAFPPTFWDYISDGEPFGWELLLDCYQCNPEWISSEERITEFVEDLLVQIDMKAFGPLVIEWFGLASEKTAGFSETQTAIGKLRPFVDVGEVRRLSEAGLLVDVGAFKQLIETSLVSGHLSAALRRTYINVFSCRQFNPDTVIAVVKKYFGTETVRDRLVVRV
jgi:hypothetical protein